MPLLPLGLIPMLDMVVVLPSGVLVVSECELLVFMVHSPSALAPVGRRPMHRALLQWLLRKAPLKQSRQPPVAEQLVRLYPMASLLELVQVCLIRKPAGVVGAQVVLLAMATPLTPIRQPLTGPVLVPMTRFRAVTPPFVHRERLIAVAP